MIINPLNTKDVFKKLHKHIVGVFWRIKTNTLSLPKKKENRNVKASRKEINKVSTNKIKQRELTSNALLKVS